MAASVDAVTRMSEFAQERSVEADGEGDALWLAVGVALWLAVGVALWLEVGVVVTEAVGDAEGEADDVLRTRW